MAVAALALLSIPAFADNIVNDVTAGVATNGDTITTTTSTTIAYKVVGTGNQQGDPVSGCNASVESSTTVTLSVPADVTASPASLTFNSCNSPQNVTFSSSIAGDYNISATVQGAGAYNTNPANWTLHVTGPDAADNCPGVDNPDQADADGDGLGNACDSNSYAPQIVIDADNTSGHEGSEQTNSGAFSDQDGNGSLSITATGAGTVTPHADGTWSWAYTPADNGSGTVTVTASDGEHTDAVDSFNWIADNVVPSISGVTVGSGTGTACIAGNNATLDFGFTDPGVNDNPWAVDINWGDGSADTTYNTASQGAQPQQSHSYGAGTYTIGISVTDKDHGTGTGGSANGAISHTWLMSGILAPFNADGSSIWKYGSTAPVKVRVTDCDGNPVPGLTLHVGTQLLSSVNPANDISETASTSAADTTGVLRYDATAGQYIYNFATKNLPDGSAKYMMYVRGTDVTGTTNTGAPSPGQSYQQFALKLK